MRKVLDTRRRSSEPTILDVAAAANVSKATAARALGGYGAVSQQVRRRVADAASALEYRPNRLARSMKSGQSRTIGVVVGDIQQPFFAGAVRGITEVAQTQGWEVLLANTDEDLARERNAVRMLFEKRVDGLIVAPASSQDGGHLQALVQRGLPVVTLDRRAPAVEADSVVIDNKLAVGRAVDYLVRLGHRRIAIVGTTGPRPSSGSEPPTFDPNSLLGGGPPAELRPSGARLRGYLAALQHAAIPIEPDLMRHADYGRESAAAHALAVLTAPEPATAIITTDGLMTLGVLDAIRRAKVRVPDDVSIIGFDDADWATIVVPSITVIAQPVLQLGATAARRVLARIGGDERPPASIVLETELVVRESTGPPRA